MQPQLVPLRAGEMYDEERDAVVDGNGRGSLLPSSSLRSEDGKEAVIAFRK